MFNLIYPYISGCWIVFRKIGLAFQLFLFRIQYRKKNLHNKTHAIDIFPLENVKIGRYTYGGVSMLAFGHEGEGLEIGSFCSIADGVRFYLGGNHKFHSFSSYPFGMRHGISHDIAIPKEIYNNGKILIQDDVWIGECASILSGVTVGQGAIIGTHALVTKDVPPYAIVGGVPAKVLGYRFDEDIIAELIQLDYSKLSVDEVLRIYDKIPEKITKEDIPLIRSLFV